MSNPYFRFKQFTIHQNSCAMKVCTDACLLGAWFAERIQQYTTILDIGSGSGLLMMMLAQRSKAYIHGIELDIPCFEQLKENIGQNNWKERLIVYPGDIRSHSFPDKYDFIISNPPFYENDLSSQDEAKKLARHSRELSFKELIRAVDKNLTKDGAFGVLLPFDRWEYFNQLSELQHFYLRERLFIRHSAAHQFTRAILYFSRHKENHMPVSEMNIYNKEADSYTEEFIELMKDYYLYL